MPRIVRPRGSPQLNIRLTDAERQALDEAAARAGVHRAEFMRRALLEAISQREVST